MEDQLKHIVYNSLKDARITPPNSVWSRLEDSLDDKKKSSIPLWIKWTGVAASFLLGLFIYQGINNNHIKNQNANTIILVDTLVEKPTAPVFKNQNNLAQNTTANKEAINPTQTKEVIPPKQKTQKQNHKNNIITEKAKTQNDLIALNSKSVSFKNPNIVPPELKTLSQNQTLINESIIKENLALIEPNDENLKFRPSIGTQYAVANAMKNENSDAMDDNTEYKISGGVYLAFNSNKRFGFSTGVYYSQMNQSVLTPNYFAAANDVRANSVYAAESNSIAEKATQNSWGNINVAPTEENALAFSDNIESAIPNNYYNETNQTAGYMEVPLILKYTILKQKIGIDLQGGINTNFLVVNNASLTQEGNTLNGKTDGLKPFTSNGVAGLLMYYGFSKNFNITLEPKVKYYYESLSTSNNVDFKPMVFGVFAGLSYNF